MTTHDFSTPIPPGTLRISLAWDDHLHTADLPTPKIPKTLRAFEKHAGLAPSAANDPEAENACIAAAADAAQNGDDHVVTTAALWRFLFDPVNSAMNIDRLSELAMADGSALLAATIDVPGAGWRFQLFAMPRWPAVVPPYRATDQDR
jgi:hypothetical protein